MIKNMSFLSINFLRKVEINDLKFENMDAKCEALCKQFFDDTDKGLAEDERIEIFNQVKHE